MKVYLYLIFLLVLIACSSKKGEEDIFIPIKKELITDVPAQIIHSSLMMVIARDIDVYKEYLIVRTFTDNKYLHILNKNTGEIVTSIVAKGNGPDEIVDMADQIQIDKEGNMYWFDFNRKRLFSCNIDSIVNAPLQYRVANFDQHFTNIDLVLPLNKGYLLSLGDRYSDTNDIKRYAMADSTKIVSVYSGFPIIKNEVRSLENIYSNYRTSQHITLSPDLNKFVASEIYGGILEIFHLSDSITLNSTQPFYRSGENELHGFVDVYATNTFIYAIKIDSNLNGANPENRYNKIMVFNWDGKYIKTYQTNYNLLTLCIDEKSNRLYAIGQDISLNSELQVLSLDI